MTRAAVAALVLGPVVLLGVGAADMASFDSRAATLQRTWDADQAAGVAPAQLSSARASLRSLRDRRMLFLSYSAFSGAVLFDPFGRAESLAARGRAKALAETRQRAVDDLVRLEDVGGPNYSGYPAHAAALAGARQLADYVELDRAWEAEAQRLSDTRDQLTASSGGLTDGLPKDVVDGVSRLQTVISAASSAQVSAEPASQALARAQQYLRLEYPALLGEHDAIAGEIASAGDTVQHRINVRTRADELVAGVPGLLSLAARYALDQSATARARDDVLAAEAAGDDSRMDGATAELQRATDQLGAAVAAAQQQAAAAAMTAGIACIDGAPAQLIVIHLATQKLVAYDAGCPMLVTLVTTGRPALPTDRGTFTIRAKYASYLMHSPWPPGNQFWYPDTVVHDAMLFVPADGTFIHSAEWEPASAYGPGSENGPYGSHGCVHVQLGPLAALFAWAQVGATVVVTD